ncbi:ester cyclase [Streptomyces sp. NPDC058371]|uniref:ester cyclase n=1 Tax=Streptomyces sp. NPDC058371 TaxID=3346463 RepID=UPI00364E2EA8
MALPILENALRDPTLTQQERSNIQLVLRFRALPFRDRAAHTVEGFRPARMGMANLADIKTGDGPNYTADSIPDREDEILDIIAHGDRVWATWLIRGTHSGPLYGIPPTGRKVEVLEVGQWRIRDGLIAEAWFFVDELALVRQLGIWPQTGTTEKEH